MKRGVVNESLLRAGTGKFRDEFVQSPVEGAEPYLTKQFGDLFDYDPETGVVAKVDQNGEFEYHPNGKSANGHGYVTPEDFIKLNANKEGFKPLLKDQRPGSSGYQGGEGGSNVIKLTQAQAEDFREYQKAQKKAKDQGKEIEIVEE